MADERYTFEQTKARLDEILVQVKRKDTSLEQSLELLEEGVRLANVCNELIDQTSWRAAPGAEDAQDVEVVSEPGQEPEGEQPVGPLETEGVVAVMVEVEEEIITLEAVDEPLELEVSGAGDAVEPGELVEGWGGGDDDERD